MAIGSLSGQAARPPIELAGGRGLPTDPVTWSPAYGGVTALATVLFSTTGVSPGNLMP